MVCHRRAPAGGAVGPVDPYFAPWCFIPLLISDMASQETEIFTSLSAARSLLEQEGHRPLLLVEESALEDFTGGVQLL